MRSSWRREIVFKTVDGRDIPMQPWPQKFYVGGWVIDRDEFEVRPLTVTGIIKGVGKNFITMNYWRFMVTLRVLGFLTTGELQRLSWSHFTLRFWRHQMWWRLRIVRYSKRAMGGLRCAKDVTRTRLRHLVRQCRNEKAP